MKRHRYHSIGLIVFFSLFVPLLCSSITLGAQNEYEIVVANFLHFVRSQKKVETAQFLKGNRLDPAEPEVMIGYLAKLENGGHVLVSSSRDLTPIKSYSLDYDFEDMPVNYKNFLMKELEFHARTLHIQEATRKRTQIIKENHAKWDFLINDPKNLIRYDYVPDTHLLQTKWDQDPPFNAFMPQIGGQDTLVGCVPVALGQIMYYHQYPPTGQGQVVYEHDSKKWMAYLAKQIPWGIMPPETNLDTPQYQKDAVGRFLRDLAFANHTQFGVNDSGTTLKMDALIQNYSYSTDIASMTNADPAPFFNTIQDQIDNGLPVLLSFHEPHVGVIDGYSSNPTGKEMHINFGWGGYHDGYYFLDQAFTVAPYTFTPDLTIYYNIEPCSGTDCWVNLEPQDHVDGVCIAGQFDSPTDTDTYGIYCSGETTLTGSAESGGAFYYGIQGVQIQNMTSEPSITVEYLPPGGYTVASSLCNESECFDYLPGSSGYSICVNSDTATSGMVYCTGETQCHSGLESGDAIQGISISGRFDSAKDSDKYGIYCTGQTTLEGSRGYPNQSFYIGIYDHDGMLIQENDASATVDLPMRKYIVRLSLCNDAGTSCYTGYVDPYKDYHLTVHTGPLTQAQIAQINDAIEGPPVIDNDFQDVIIQNGSYLDIYIEAFDVNNDVVILNASSNESRIDVSFYPNNVLRITPNASHVGGEITVSATANGETTSKSFFALTMDEMIGYGKEFRINGTFQNQDTHNLHPAILEGPCTINGYNGFLNQAFYIGVMDQGQNTIVQPTNNEISHPFTRDTYVLGASLWQNPQTKIGSYYPYQQGQGDLYEITVLCPDADDSILTIANEYGISVQQCNLEICNGEDDDCDGAVDEDGAVGCTRYYKDADGDGYGVTEESYCTCLREPFGDYTTFISGDPDDINPFEKPDPEETSVTVSVGFNKGWTMFSIPVIPPDMRIRTILPDSVAVFSFSSKYDLLDPNDPLETKKGYWVYHDTPKTYDITGEPIEGYSITDIPSGWSMVGGCSFPAYSSVASGRIRALFGFSNKYFLLDPNHDPMEPAQGYWINLSEQTTLTVNVPGNNTPIELIPYIEAYLDTIPTEYNYADHTFSALEREFYSGVNGEPLLKMPSIEFDPNGTDLRVDLGMNPPQNIDRVQVLLYDDSSGTWGYGVNQDTLDLFLSETPHHNDFSSTFSLLLDGMYVISESTYKDLDNADPNQGFLLQVATDANNNYLIGSGDSATFAPTDNIQVKANAVEKIPFKKSECVCPDANVLAMLQNSFIKEGVTLSLGHLDSRGFKSPFQCGETIETFIRLGGDLEVLESQQKLGDRIKNSDYREEEPEGHFKGAHYLLFLKWYSYCSPRDCKCKCEFSWRITTVETGVIVTAGFSRGNCEDLEPEFDGMLGAIEMALNPGGSADKDFH